MSDRRRFLKGLTSIPLATVLASPGLAAAVSAGLQLILILEWFGLGIGIIEVKSITL